METLPQQVQEVNEQIREAPSHPYNKITQKIVGDFPDQIYLWNTIKKHETGEDDLWVWHFLEAAKKASCLPKYYYGTKSDREKLADRIKSLSKELLQLITAHDLDVCLIPTEVPIADGKVEVVYTSRDLWMLNDPESVIADTKNLQISDVIKSYSDRIQFLIGEEPIKGKSGKNVKAIRFVRFMVNRNSQLYNRQLFKVVAIAANLIFDTNYSQNDIYKLISR